MSKTYTEEEVQELLDNQNERIEAKHFEEKTEQVLADIYKRLGEANGYKATIGRDVKTALVRLDALEGARKAEAEAAKQARAERHQWYQDGWIRFGIAVASFGVLGTLVWEILNIWISLQNAITASHPAIR